MTPQAGPSVVEDLVGNAHGNLARVRELLEAHPDALNGRAPWNETAIEAATQMGNKPILDFLIARGAPVDFFTACVLGRVDDVAAELAADPTRAVARGVHDLPALYFGTFAGQRRLLRAFLDGHQWQVTRDFATRAMSMTLLHEFNPLGGYTPPLTGVVRLQDLASLLWDSYGPNRAV